MRMDDLRGLFAHESFQRLVGILGSAIRAAWQHTTPELTPLLEELAQLLQLLGQLAFGQLAFGSSGGDDNSNGGPDRSAAACQGEIARLLGSAFVLLLAHARESDPGLSPTAADLEWLWQQLERRQEAVFLLVVAALVLAAQTSEPGLWLTPSDLARLTGEGEATWRQRLQRWPDRYLAAKVGPRGTWIVPRSAALAQGMKLAQVRTEQPKQPKKSKRKKGDH